MLTELNGKAQSADKSYDVSNTATNEYSDYCDVSFLLTYFSHWGRCLNSLPDQRLLLQIFVI